MDKADQRQFERLEERLHATEREVAILTSQLSLIKEDSEKNRVDLRERLDDLKLIIKEDIEAIGGSIDTLSKTVKDVNDSLQQLYITQKGSTTKVKTNEKIIWAIITLIASIGFYMLQQNWPMP